MGHLNSDQSVAVQPHVKDRVVFDLGAGDLELSKVLLTLGASKIVAIDRHEMPDPDSPHIRRVTGYFDDVVIPAGLDLVFMSWPVNWQTGLVSWALAAKTIIYLGSCTGGSMCGTPQLWDLLSRREILTHVPSRSGTLTVYGPKYVKRNRLLEEQAGIDDQTLYRYEDTSNSLDEDWYWLTHGELP